MVKSDIAPLDHDTVIDHEEAKAACEFSEAVTYSRSADCLPVRLDQQDSILGEMACSFIQPPALPHVTDR